jgi:hypothetical protein
MNELKFETTEASDVELKAADQATEAAIQELAQCDLLFVGGGSGNVIF